jgi:hypothetical protein
VGIYSTTLGGHILIMNCLIGYQYREAVFACQVVLCIRRSMADGAIVKGRWSGGHSFERSNIAIDEAKIEEGVRCDGRFGRYHEWDSIIKE